jgi:multiple sugar transport system permease protein
MTADQATIRSARMFTRTRGGIPRSHWPKIAAFVCALVTLVSLIPIIMMVLVGFQSDAQALATPPDLWPSTWHADNIGKTLSAAPLVQYLVNTVIFAGSTTVLETATAACAAYAFARLSFRGRDVLFILYLATLMVPPQVTIIPQFIMIAQLQWVDSWQGMIIPQAFTALGTFLLRQYFLTIPRDYEEAARLDGANRWKCFIRIIVPLSLPAVAAVAVFKFIAQWNNLLWPLVVSNSDSTRTVSVGLRVFAGTYVTQWNLLLIGSAMATIPVVLVFLLAQKWFVRGISMSGLGGR